MYNNNMNFSFLKNLLFTRHNVALAVLLSLSLISSIYILDMDMQMNNKCALYSMTTSCSMGPLEHLTAWQSLYSALPSDTTTLPLFALFFVLVFITILWKSPPFDLANVIITKQKSYARTQRNLIFTNALRQAFSSGILNTKVY